MTPTLPIDAARWARLKDHVADLASLEHSARVEALNRVTLSEDDREWLLRLAEPLLANDSRLAGSHPSTRAAVEREKLRWRKGETIGKYRIENLIGRGGMGEVYEARSLETDQIVALKVLRTGLDQVDYAKFSDNEQRALRRLDDPRIAKFLEAFSTPDVGTCLVLEWIDGEPLQSYCRDRRYDVDTRLRLFVEVCQAVASAHRQLVIHRDLKPSNVLVTPDGHVKLLDFGVSKLLDEGESATQTQTHGDLFTPDYAAPEQVLNEPVSTATDIYALGGLLFRLLTDVSPYLRADGGSLIKAVLGEPPQKLAAAVQRARNSGGSPPKGQIDADLDRVVGRAMDKDPKARYRSVLELAGDIEAILGGRPISSGGSPYYRMGKFVRRHRASAAGAIVAIVAFATAGAFGIHESRMTAQHAHRADVANRFLLTALDLTDRFSSSNTGDFTLGEVLERAVAKARSDLADEPSVRATVLGQLATALKHLGKTDLARSALGEAYEIRKSTSDTTGMERAEVAQNLASIEIELGQVDAAGKHLREALAALDASDLQDPVHIATLTSLGKLASMMGNAEESLLWYERILPIRKSLPGDHRAEVAMDYNNLGTGLYNLSRFRESDAAYAQGIALLEAQFGSTHPRLGFVQSSRAACQIQLGHFAEAAGLLDRAEASLGKNTGTGSGRVGSTNIERMRALLDFYAGNYAAAMSRVELALAQVRISSPVSVGGTLALRARIELAAGKPETAETTLAETERLYVQDGRGAHVQRWVAHGLRGVALAAAGHAEEGDKELETAIGQVATNGVSGVELLELTLLDGSADRRRGDIASALRKHRHAREEQHRLEWLGELGEALVDAELILDAADPGADASSREFLHARLLPTIATLQRVVPNHPLLTPLLALRRIPHDPAVSSAGRPAKA